MLPTHSQKSFTQLSVWEQGLGDGDGASIDLHELLEVLEGELHVVQGLLKRPDEAELVLRAHKDPQFVEDVVRRVARQAKDAFKERLRPRSRIMVESVSQESIHTHNVKARLEITV